MVKASVGDRIRSNEATTVARQRRLGQVMVNIRLLAEAYEQRMSKPSVANAMQALEYGTALATYNAAATTISDEIESLQQANIKLRKKL